MLILPGCGSVDKGSTQPVQTTGSKQKSDGETKKETSLPEESASELESEVETVIQLEENEEVGDL